MFPHELYRPQNQNASLLEPEPEEPLLLDFTSRG